MKHCKTFAAAGCLLAAAIPAAGHASIVVNIDEAGGNVVASYSGSLNRTGLTYVAAGLLENVMLYGTYGFLQFGLPEYGRALGVSVSGPASWGTGLNANSPTSYTGDFFGIDASRPGDARIYLPLVYNDGSFYMDGAALSGTETFTGATFALLGLNTGQYVYTAGGNQTITVNIGYREDAGPVPEPSSWALMIAGFGLAGAAMRGSKRAPARLQFQ